MTYSIKTLAAAAAAVATLGLAGTAGAATWGDEGYHSYGRIYEPRVLVVAQPVYTPAMVPAYRNTNLCETDEGVLRTVWAPAGTRCRAVTPNGTLARGIRIPR